LPAVVLCTAALRGTVFGRGRWVLLPPLAATVITMVANATNGTTIKVRRFIRCLRPSPG
jgi:hypothetical protein